MKRYLPFVIIAAVLLVGLTAGALMLRSNQPESTSSTAPVAKPTVTTGVTTAKGVVTIEEFGDYQCPPCGLLHPEMKKIKQEFGDRIRFIFYHLPLVQIHPNAMPAAQAAVAAGVQGKFWEMHNLLYENQKMWAEAPDLRLITVNFARQLGLDTDWFIRDLDGAQVNTTISADMRRASSLGVNGTPTVFVDGQLVETDKMTVDGLRQMISQRLNAR
ncbi:MAG: DsbA family protein [Acidobacteria bacterium]|nr:DsbA family protein [Acidobacteriota bacterium]